MDELSAHLDRGWNLAERGDVQGARQAAEHALSLDPDNADAHHLMGFIGALDGECDDAVESYRQAFFLDETFVEAMLNAAELLIHPLQDYDEALRLVSQALAVDDSEELKLEAKLLRIEAYLGQGAAEAVVKTIESLPEGPFDAADHNVMVGRALVESGAYERAEPLLRAAVEQEPDSADASYYLGVLLEGQGRRHAASIALLRARQLELEVGLPAWAPNPESFLMFTQNAIRALSNETRTLLEGSEVYLADVPGAEVVVEGIDPRSMALADLVTTEDQSEEEEVLAETGARVRVFLYVLNVLRAAGSLHAVQATIEEALTRELKALRDDLVALEADL